MYALVEIKGKQYKAEKGSLLKVDLFEETAGEKLQFDSVLLTSEGENVAVGTPFVSGASVKATIESHVKGNKLVITKYKRRKGYKRRIGHRQNYTLIRVDEVISA